MSYSLSSIKQDITKHPYFQKTKDIIENNPCHNRETVYDHLLVTCERAEKAIQGEFLSNKKGRDLFLSWLDGEKNGFLYKDTAVIVALLHDIGKIAMFTENGNVHSIVMEQKNKQTLALGHEYYGSKVAKKLLTDIGFEKEVINYIASIVRLHGSLMFPVYDKTKTVDEFISEMKAQAEGLHKEVLLNIYADVGECTIFQGWIGVIKQMFDSPELYVPREYAF